MRKLIFWFVLVATQLAGCAGLQFDFVRTGTQVELNGFTPAVTAYVMERATPVVKAGCPNGVRSDERRIRSERIPPDPTIYGSQHRDASDATLRIECVTVSPYERN